MARDDPHFRLRLPPELKAQVEEAARAAGRSINTEIVQRLEASFAAPQSALTEARLRALLEEYLGDIRSDLLGDAQRERD